MANARLFYKKTSFYVLQTGKFVFCAWKIFSPSNLRAWKNRHRIFSPYTMVYFASIFFKFCALDWSFRAWQFACARKIFSAHYILSSLDVLPEPPFSKMILEMRLRFLVNRVASETGKYVLRAESLSRASKLPACSSQPSTQNLENILEKYTMSHVEAL